MKTRILTYSKTDSNKVVSHYENLEKIGEGVYTYLYRKNLLDEQLDMLGIVLRVENVYFEIKILSRRMTREHGIDNFGAGYATNFRQKVEDDMQNDRHVSALTARVFKELGWDSESIIKYREQWSARRETERKREEQEKAAAAADLFTSGQCGAIPAYIREKVLI